jgi:hypothetical protein
MIWFGENAQRCGFRNSFLIIIFEKNHQALEKPLIIPAQTTPADLQRPASFKKANNLAEFSITISGRRHDYLVRDRHGIYGKYFTARVEGLGIR